MTFALGVGPDVANLVDTQAILTAMQKQGLERLIVRLGFEIFVPDLKSAMDELNVMPMYNQRVIVNLPWEKNGVLALSNKLSADIDQLKQLNITQARQLAATEKRLSKMEQRKDPAEQLRQLKCYRDTVLPNENEDSAFQ